MSIRSSREVGRGRESDEVFHRAGAVAQEAPVAPEGEALIEEYEDFYSTHVEYDDTIDADDIEARRIHQDISHELRRLSPMIRELRRGDALTRQKIEEIEEALAVIGDLFAELGSVV